MEKITMWIIANSVDCTVYEKSLSYTRRGAVANLADRYGIDLADARVSDLIIVKLVSEETVS